MILGDLDYYKKLSVRNLGVNFDSALKFDKPINSVVKKPRVFCHLKSWRE